jgi:hypothetical protein
MTSRDERLCYLDASRVESPAGDLGRLRIETGSDQPLGSLDGVLIDPSERRIRYFVVKSDGWFNRRRYLISTDCLAKVEPERNTLRLDVEPEDLHRLDEGDRAAIREFSEEDAIEAMFAHVA